MWWPVRKYLVSGWKKTRLYDETNTGDEWYGIQVRIIYQLDYDVRITGRVLQSSLPTDEEYPNCYLPLHIWLDKGNMTKKVKKHPMVLRPAFLPREIRNASGNGGGILLGYMPVASIVPALYRMHVLTVYS